jgi:photosystem II stability/assembly factor-like uncharacterized protein
MELMQSRVGCGVFACVASFVLAGCGATAALSTNSGQPTSAGLQKYSLTLTPRANTPLGIPREIHFTSQKQGWAISGGPPSTVGYIAYSNNSGSSWLKYGFPGVTFTVINSSNSQSATAIGSKNQSLFIATTVNGGKSWEITLDPHPPFDATYLKKAYPFDNGWLVLSSSGRLWHYNGKRWQTIPTPKQAIVKTWVVHSPTVYAVLGQDRLASTNDRGKTWHTLVDTHGSQTITAFTTQGTNEWVLEQRAKSNQTTNTLLFSSNQGNTFSQIYTGTLPSTLAWNRIDMVNQTDGWAAGGSCSDVIGNCANTLYRTTNGARTWKRISLPSVDYHYPNPNVPPAHLTGFRPTGFFTSTNTMISVGYLPPNVASPTIFSTSDGGQQWIPTR